MGLDNLYRETHRDASQRVSALAAEGLVPIDLWRGQPLELVDWSATADAMAALQSHVPTLDDPIRRAFLEDTLRSLATTVAWQAGGDGLSFREHASRLLGLSIEPTPTETLERWRRDLWAGIGTDVLDWERSRAVDPPALAGDVPEPVRPGARAHARGGRPRAAAGPDAAEAGA